MSISETSTTQESPDTPTEESQKKRGNTSNHPSRKQEDQILLAYDSRIAQLEKDLKALKISRASYLSTIKNSELQ